MADRPASVQTASHRFLTTPIWCFGILLAASSRASADAVRDVIHE